MTSLSGDIVNRVKRLPKPTLAAEALQPVFEAVSNSLHAVEDAFGDAYQQRGLINVTITSPRTPADIQIIVSDNGVGLEPDRFKAFAQALIPIRIHRDKERNDTIQEIVQQLGATGDMPADFAETVRKADRLIAKLSKTHALFPLR
jgi:DNA topoisomerase VI subunit B